MLNWLTSIFFASNCPLCGRTTEGDVVCRDCDRQLYHCEFPQSQRLRQQSLALFVWGKYEGPLKRAIAATKYDNKPEVGEWLGIQLGLAWQQQFSQQQFPQKQRLIVIPIPMYPDKQKARGFNQADLIAKGFTQVTRLKCDRHVLQRVKATQALFSLNFAQRQQEIQQSFQLNPQHIKRLQNKHVLLIDDIYTSGATAREAAITLRKQGIKVWGIAAIATPKSSSTPVHRSKKF